MSAGDEPLNDDVTLQDVLISLEVTLGVLQKVREELAELRARVDAILEDTVTE